MNVMDMIGDMLFGAEKDYAAMSRDFLKVHRKYLSRKHLVNFLAKLDINVGRQRVR